MLTIYRETHNIDNDTTLALYVAPEKGAGNAKYLTEFEAVQLAEKGSAVIVDRQLEQEVEAGRTLRESSMRH